ncbi:polyphosphate kinase 2 [Afifella aestuarii]|uniref:polyphosphate kinase 2 n=1 Tax=Afifella aestuarii TaxID=1909496 RepID=UPI000FE3CB03|nr:polyphosphate kinase 2 [Afifella aestuarii]
MNNQDFSTFNLDAPELPAWVHENALTSGNFPYSKKLKRTKYENELRDLQRELVQVLAWAQNENQRIVLLFEGRDAAGKGGSIKVVRENLNPRHARIVALAKPTEREHGQWYFQRYVEELPSNGEMVLFDRSWYNRGVVEPVMGFCSETEAAVFLREAPDFERMLVRDGVHLFKFWLNIGREMQLKRFHDRRHDPLKSWKISPVDKEAIKRWPAFSAARDRMLAATHSQEAPWYVVRANDKRRARLNLIRTVLLSLPYDGKNRERIGELDEAIVSQGPEFLSEVEASPTG